MHIQVVNGAKKFDVELPDDSDLNENWTLSTLKEKIENLTNIPSDSQRLILKGRTVLGDNIEVKSLGLKPGDKIMVLAGSKPNNIVVDENLKNLQRIETTVINGIEAKLSEFDSTLEGVEKGFLNDDLVEEALSKMEKQLKHFGEDCMKTLELMDSMPLSDNGSDKARIKRKSLVNTIHSLLHRHDVLHEKVANLTSKLKESV